MGIFLAEHIALSLQATREEPVDESALHGGKDISAERKAARATRRSADPSTFKNRAISTAAKAIDAAAETLAGAKPNLAGKFDDRLKAKAAAEKDARRAAIRAAVFKRRDDHRRKEKEARGWKHSELQAVGAFKSGVSDSAVSDARNHLSAKTAARMASAEERKANRLKRKRTAQGFSNLLNPSSKKKWPKRPKRFPIGQKKAYDPASATWVDKAKHPSLMTRLRKD